MDSRVELAARVPVIIQLYFWKFNSMKKIRYFTHVPSVKDQLSWFNLTRFLYWSNAASSILAASIFENLPYKKVESKDIDKPLMGQKALSVQSMITKRLLVFSDNRQDAAFFAAYLQSTYENLLKRRLLLKTARQCAPRYLEKGIPLTKLAH